MASITVYGSSVADGTLSTACDLTTNTGGTETTKATDSGGGSGNFFEITSKGGAVNSVASIPVPTGKGWVYNKPGAGTFATGNWSGFFTMAINTGNTGDTSTVRFYRYSSGTYTSIGSINFTASTAAKTTYTLAATSMSSITFGASDLLYVDAWYQDTTGSVGDTVTVYETTSATAGLANDVQITTSNFTASGGGPAPSSTLSLMGVG